MRPGKPKPALLKPGELKTASPYILALNSQIIMLFRYDWLTRHSQSDQARLEEVQIAVMYIRFLFPKQVDHTME